MKSNEIWNEEARRQLEAEINFMSKEKIELPKDKDYLSLYAATHKTNEEIIEEKDKEIERLKNGYCELKVKCNNGECDCTNEEYDGMVESNIKLSLEVDRLNNIIDELEKWLEESAKYEPYVYNGILDKLKELKEGVNNE